MNTEFGKNLKNLREKHQLTQKEVAQEFSVSQNLVFQWEHGKSEPRLDILLDLADFFNVTVDDLVGKCFSRSKTTNQEITETEQQILTAVKALDENQKQNVLGYINGFSRATNSIKKYNH